MPRSAHATRHINAQALQLQFQNHQHHLYVLDPQDLVRLFIADKKHRFLWSDVDVEAWLKTHSIALAGGTLQFASQYGTATIDSVTLGKLATEMVRSGSILNTYRVVYQKGRPYVVFKGNAGLRRIFTGTRYGAENPKLIAMGVGKTALKAGAKSGFMIGMAFSVTFDLETWMTTDQETIPQLLGHISADLLKNALSTGAGLAVGLALADGAAIAVAPLALSIFVGVAVGFWLGDLDQEYRITKRHSAGIAEFASRIEPHARPEKLSPAWANAEVTAASRNFGNTAWW